MKAFNVCSECGRKIHTIVRDIFLKNVLERDNPNALCKECDKNSSWRVTK